MDGACWLQLVTLLKLLTRNTLRNVPNAASSNRRVRLHHSYRRQARRACTCKQGAAEGFLPTTLRLPMH